MKKNMKFYLKLFSATFSLSAFTFGGGFVIIPLMRKKFVDKYKWIDEKEMLDLTAIAQSSPGSIAVNASILVGYRLAGVSGSIVTILGTLLPPLIISSTISFAYTAFRESLLVNYLLKGMQAGVLAIILDVVVNMIAELRKEKKVLPVLVMIGAFIAAFLFDVNIILIILLCGIIGVTSLYYSKRRERGGDL